MDRSSVNGIFNSNLTHAPPIEAGKETMNKPTKRELRKKYPKSRYCEYYGVCDKEYDCKKGNFCKAFVHSKTFSSLRLN